MSGSSDGDWRPDGATRDGQSVTAKWLPSDARLVEGVRVDEVSHVPGNQGYLTEIFRSAWAADGPPVHQVFQVVLTPGAVSAWHAHEDTTDRLFVTHGLVRIAIYDSRPGSPTRGRMTELRFGTVRPALVTIPPRLWHGVQNVGDSVATVLNLVDHAYDYDAPDHWRLPSDTTMIPFAWTARP